MFDDEIWDEERWEAFLKKNDERVARYMKLLHRFLDEHPSPHQGDEREQQAWWEAFNAYLIQYGWYAEEPESTSFHLEDESEEDQAFPELPADELELPEEEPAFADFTTLPVYQEAHSLTRDVLAWSDSLPGSEKDSTLVQFCASIMQITANIAKGHGIGQERDMLGGNIACLKRGIQAANAALELLLDMRGRPYLPDPTYLSLYEKTYEVRNQVGIYIQELRDRFNLGID